MIHFSPPVRAACLLTASVWLTAAFVIAGCSPGTTGAGPGGSGGSTGTGGVAGVGTGGSGGAGAGGDA